MFSQMRLCRRIEEIFLVLSTNVSTILYVVTDGTVPTAFAGNKTVPPLCPGGCTPIDKPIVDTSATVYVVFGLKAIDRSMITREHVLESKVNSSPLTCKAFVF